METANTTDVKNLLRNKQLISVSLSVSKHQKNHTEYQWSVQEHIEISKICSLPPDLLIQGKTGPWPVKGAPSKLQWWSIYRKRTFKSKKEKKPSEKSTPKFAASQPRKPRKVWKNKKVVPKIVRLSNSAAAVTVRKHSFCKLTTTTNSYDIGKPDLRVVPSLF